MYAVHHMLRAIKLRSWHILIFEGLLTPSLFWEAVCVLKERAASGWLFLCPQKVLHPTQFYSSITTIASRRYSVSDKNTDFFVLLFLSKDEVYSLGFPLLQVSLTHAVPLNAFQIHYCFIFLISDKKEGMPASLSQISRIPNLMQDESLLLI